MGFEGMIYYGAAGTTATTLLENVKDISYTMDVEKGNTTVRGDSTVPPIETEDVTIRKVSIEWTMIHDITDTALEAIRVAAHNGTNIAVRTKDYTSGKGFDGDCSVSIATAKPLAGEQAFTITATPSRSNGRTPSLYV